MTRCEEIGKVLRARIEEIGITQAEVARRSGMSPQNVNAILKGTRHADVHRPASTQVSAGVALRLAAAVGWTAEELVEQLSAAAVDPEVAALLPVDIVEALADHYGMSIAELCGLEPDIADPEDNTGADRRKARA